jgi:pimeloyl-ACP methyl ester carboxylesterase
MALSRRTKVIVAVLASPLWLPLLLAAVCLGLLWYVVGRLLTSVPLATAAGLAALAAAAIARGLEVRPDATADLALYDDAVLAGGLMAFVATAHAAALFGLRRDLATVVSAVAAVISVVYVAVRHADRVATQGDAVAGTPAALAVVALAIAAPVVQLLSVSRCWRRATPEQASAAQARVFSKTVKTPFTQRVVAGMHTAEFASTGSGGGGGDADDKPALVILHGYAAGGVFFMFNVDAFTDRYRVFVCDWLGCGASDRVPFTAATTAEAEEYFLAALERWREAQGLESMFVIGHSMGGYLSAAYALRHPHRVRHLVLASPGGVPSQPVTGPPKTASGGMVPNNPKSPTPRVIPSWLWATVAFLWRNNFTPGVLLRYFGPLGPTFTRAGVRRRAERWVLQQPILPIQEDLGIYLYHNICSDGAGEFALRHIFAPGVWAYAPIGERLLAAASAGSLVYPVTFAYGGSHDWMNADAGEAVCKQLRALGCRAECHRTPMSGHHLYLENPHSFNATVLAELTTTREAEEAAEQAAAVATAKGGAGALPVKRASRSVEVQEASAVAAADVGVTTS